MEIRSDLVQSHMGGLIAPTAAFGGLESTAIGALNAIKIIDQNAIIAGGACRNALLHLPINDIDIYLHLPQGQTQASMLGRLSSLGFTDVRSAEQAPDSAYDSMPHLIGVIKCMYQGFPVDVMTMDEPTFGSVVPNFCANVSKCWSDGNNIRASGVATMDMRNNTITIPSNVRAPARYISKLELQLEPSQTIVNGEIQESPNVRSHARWVIELDDLFTSIPLEPTPPRPTVEPTSNRYYEEMDEYMELEEEVTNAG